MHMQAHMREKKRETLIRPQHTQNNIVITSLCANVSMEGLHEGVHSLYGFDCR